MTNLFKQGRQVFLVDLGQDSSNLSKTMNNHLKSLNSKDYAENVLARSRRFVSSDFKNTYCYEKNENS